MQIPESLKAGVGTLNFAFADLNIILAMAAAAVVAIAMIGYAFSRPAESSEAMERKRRLHLNQIGRIAEGQIVEFGEHPPEPAAKPKTLFGFGARPLPDNQLRQLVSYSYAISGVTYHTAQDITGLKARSVSNAWWPGNPPALSTIPQIPAIPFWWRTTGPVCADGRPAHNVANFVARRLSPEPQTSHLSYSCSRDS